MYLYRVTVNSNQGALKYTISVVDYFVQNKTWVLFSNKKSTHLQVGK